MRLMRGEVMPMKAILTLMPKPPIAQRGDNHRPGCWDTNLVTTHQKGEVDVGSRQGMLLRMLGVGLTFFLMENPYVAGAQWTRRNTVSQ
jgi:hypothetical protein